MPFLEPAIQFVWHATVATNRVPANWRPTLWLGEPKNGSRRIIGPHILAMPAESVPNAFENIYRFPTSLTHGPTGRGRGGRAPI